MKVLIIGAAKTGGGNVKVTAYRKFLQSRDHIVNVIQIPGENFSSKLILLLQPLYSSLTQSREMAHEKNR